MHENFQANNDRSEANGQQGCCTPASSAKAALKADPKTKSGENSEANAAQKPAESGCCCGSKSPNR